MSDEIDTPADFDPGFPLATHYYEPEPAAPLATREPDAPAEPEVVPPPTPLPPVPSADDIVIEVPEDKPEEEPVPDPPSLGEYDADVFLAAVDRSALNAEKWASVRKERDGLLTSTDWVVTKSMETSVAITPDWLAYRAALRNITSQLSPFAIEWPVAPVSAAPVVPTYRLAADQSTPLTVVGNQTVDAIRASKSAEILVWRLEAERAGFDWNGQWFETGVREGVDYQAKLVTLMTEAKIREAAPKTPIYEADGVTQKVLNGHLQWVPIAFVVQYPLINNGFVWLFHNLIMSVIMRYEDNMARIYQKARNLQALVDAETDPTVLATVTWNSVPFPASD